MDYRIDPNVIITVGIIATIFWLAVIALSIWLSYLLTRTAVKNGMIRAHEELDRREQDRELAERQREQSAQYRRARREQERQYAENPRRLPPVDPPAK